MDVEGQHQLLLATRRGDLALVKILILGSAARH